QSPTHQITQSLNKKGVLVVAAALAGAVVTQLAECLERGAERGDQRAPLARGRADGRLDAGEGLLDAHRHVPEDPAGALDLRGRERRRARGVAADGVQVAENR